MHPTRRKAQAGRTKYCLTALEVYCTHVAAIAVDTPTGAPTAAASLPVSGMELWCVSDGKFHYKALL